MDSIFIKQSHYERLKLLDIMAEEFDFELYLAINESYNFSEEEKKNLHIQTLRIYEFHRNLINKLKTGLV